MRILPAMLALLLGLAPALQAYGKTMAQAHCRANGHISATAPDAAHDALHAQHHAPDAGAHADHAAGGAEAKADGAHCQCGCLCNVACGSGAAVPAFAGAAGAAPSHEPWQLATDIRHPVSVHDSLLRPPRSLLS